MGSSGGSNLCYSMFAMFEVQVCVFEVRLLKVWGVRSSGNTKMITYSFLNNVILFMVYLYILSSGSKYFQYNMVCDVLIIQKQKIHCCSI